MCGQTRDGLVIIQDQEGRVALCADCDRKTTELRKAQKVPVAPVPADK